MDVAHDSNERGVHVVLHHFHYVTFRHDHRIVYIADSGHFSVKWKLKHGVVLKKGVEYRVLEDFHR